MKVIITLIVLILAGALSYGGWLLYNVSNSVKAIAGAGGKAIEFLNAASSDWSVLDIEKHFNGSVYNEEHDHYQSIMRSNQYLGKVSTCDITNASTVGKEGYGNTVTYQGECSFANGSAQIKIVLASIRAGYEVVYFDVK